MSEDSGRQLIVPPPNLEVDDTPGSLGPTTSVIPPPPDPLPPARASFFPARASLMPAARKSIESLLPAARNSIMAARASIQSMLPWTPRWKPWTPQRALSATLGFAAAFGLFMYVAWPGIVKYARAHHFELPGLTVAAADVPVVTPAAETAKIAAADANLTRTGRSPVAGGILSIPAGFHSSDGAYDLVIHFHGNTDLVEESISTAKLNAVLVIFNLGIGSGPYEDKFSVPGLMPEILDRVKTTLQKRGLENPHMRNFALSAWSAGYGAVERILEQPGMMDKVDSVILLDGIHVGYMQDGRTLDALRLKIFVDYARRAAAGEKLMFITHSNIVPSGYAGTHATTDAVLKEVGVERKNGTDSPAMPTLTSLQGVLAKDKVRPLQQQTHAEKGGLFVRGYGGESPEDHMSHLMQMSVTALPTLIERWSAQSKRSP